MNLQSLYVGPMVADIAIGFIVLETLLLWLLYTCLLYTSDAADE